MAASKKPEGLTDRLWDMRDIVQITDEYKASQKANAVAYSPCCAGGCMLDLNV
jgi:hypothetical protein